MSDPAIARLGAHVAQLEAAGDVTLVWRRARHQSTLYRFARSQAGDVIVKTPRPGRPPVERARLYPVTEPSAKPALELRALRAAHADLSRGPEAGIAALRPLGELPEPGAIVLEAIDRPTLHELLGRPEDHATALAACRNAGRWLRRFHALDGVTGDELRRTPEDVAEAFAALAAGLRGTPVAGRVARRVAAAAARVLPTLLPDELPLGLGHGDFAARNVFVGPGGEVTVFDTLGRWRVPVYEDLAYFTIALRTGRPGLVPAGPRQAARTAALGRALHDGYFGDEPVPGRELAAFELLCLLDKWCSLAATGHDAAGRNRLAWGAYRGLAAARLPGQARTRLGRLEPR